MKRLVFDVILNRWISTEKEPSKYYVLKGGKLMKYGITDLNNQLPITFVTIGELISECDTGFMALKEKKGICYLPEKHLV